MPRVPAQTELFRNRSKKLLIQLDTKVLTTLSYGLYVLGAFDEGRPVGCIVNTVFQITADPARIAVSVNKNNHTLKAIRERGRFSVSVLAEDSNPEIIGRFGFFSSRDTDKYADFGYEVIGGVPCVTGRFAGRLILEAEDFVDCGSHELVIAHVADTVAGEGTPMTYAYYHRVIKGKAPKNAPTYRPEADDEASQGKKLYRCDICGYEVEYDGPLPADYRCPICGADRSHFLEV